MNGVMKKKQNLSKKKIVNSAMMLFATKGFDSTSTREICKHAGVNLSLISYYFENKDGLYTNIIESIVNFGLEQLQDDIAKSKNVSQMSYDEKVNLYCTLLEKYIDFLYSESVPNSFVILMLKEQTVSHSKFSEMFSKKIDVLYNALIKILASILGKKETDKMVTLEVFSIIGQILSFKLVEKASLTFLKQYRYTSADNRKVKTMVYSYIGQSLEKLNIKRECHLNQ